MGAGTSDFVEASGKLESILSRKSCCMIKFMGRHNTFHCSICANCNFKIQIHYAGRPFYQIGVLGFKAALCVAYIRILSRGQRLYRIIVWAVMITCIAGHVACTLVLIFQCRPVSISPRWSSLHLILTTFKVQKTWIPATIGSCLPDVPTFTGLAIVTIVYDIIIFLLPIPLIWTLQIRKRRKIALMGVFLLGFFTTLCSFLRLSRIALIAMDGDLTYLVLWGTIELNVGVSNVISLPSINIFHAD